MATGSEKRRTRYCQVTSLAAITPSSSLNASGEIADAAHALIQQGTQRFISNQSLVELAASQCRRFLNPSSNSANLERMFPASSSSKTNAASTPSTCFRLEFCPTISIRRCSILRSKWRLVQKRWTTHNKSKLLRL